MATERQTLPRDAAFTLEHILDALGIEWRDRYITGASIVFEPNRPPTLRVDYLITDENVESFAQSFAGLKVANGSATVTYDMSNGV